jgi:hypothetical protein
MQDEPEGHRAKPKAGFPQLPTALGNNWRDSHIPTAATRRAMEKWKAKSGPSHFPTARLDMDHCYLVGPRSGAGARIPLDHDNHDAV